MLVDGLRKLGSRGAVRPPQPRRLRTFRLPWPLQPLQPLHPEITRALHALHALHSVCMYVWAAAKGGRNSIDGVRFLKKFIPLPGPASLRLNGKHAPSS